MRAGSQTLRGAISGDHNISHTTPNCIFIVDKQEHVHVVENAALRVCRAQTLNGLSDCIPSDTVDVAESAWYVCVVMHWRRRQWRSRTASYFILMTVSSVHTCRVLHSI
jgi:hypothetical protein